MIFIESTVQILLSSEQEASLKQYVYTTILDEIKKARSDARLDIRYLSKKETCTYLGIANNTLDKWIGAGLPLIRVCGVVRFNREQIDKWLAYYSKNQSGAV